MYSSDSPLVQGLVQQLGGSQGLALIIGLVAAGFLLLGAWRTRDDEIGSLALVLAASILPRRLRGSGYAIVARDSACRAHPRLHAAPGLSFSASATCTGGGRRLGSGASGLSVATIALTGCLLLAVVRPALSVRQAPSVGSDTGPAARQPGYRPVPGSSSASRRLTLAHAHRGPRNRVQFPTPAPRVAERRSASASTRVKTTRYRRTSPATSPPAPSTSSRRRRAPTRASAAHSPTNSACHQARARHATVNARTAAIDASGQPVPISSSNVRPTRGFSPPRRSCNAGPDRTRASPTLSAPGPFRPSTTAQAAGTREHANTKDRRRANRSPEAARGGRGSGDERTDDEQRSSGLGRHRGGEEHAESRRTGTAPVVSQRNKQTMRGRRMQRRPSPQVRRGDRDQRCRAGEGERDGQLRGPRITSRSNAQAARPNATRTMDGPMSINA